LHLLVVGGAGYIGSVTVAEALAAGHRVTVLDSLVTGHRAAISPNARFVQADFGDIAVLDRLLSEDCPDGVVYYGGFIAAGESMEKPGLYFANNVSGVITLLNALVEHGVRRFVFSSSAAVYGDPETLPIPEDAPLVPTNPYAESKVVIERLLRWYDSQCGLRSVSLRYFNAAGATETLGEDHRPETHLIPLVLQVALGRRPTLDLYGTDYPTPDGTCLRDYVHVVDLARAHLLALARCQDLPVSVAGGQAAGSAVYNLGNGRGFSNRQVIDAAQRVTGRPIPVRECPRRPGDPVSLTASNERARRELGWEPQLPGLEDIIESAWRWHQAHPEGYSA
jgi:UDP-glucose 4-epimerase